MTLTGLLMLVPVWLFVVFCTMRVPTKGGRRVGMFVVGWMTAAMLLIAYDAP
jgi:hypothetical protein